MQRSVWIFLLSKPASYFISIEKIFFAEFASLFTNSNFKMLNDISHAVYFHCMKARNQTLFVVEEKSKRDTLFCPTEEKQTAKHSFVTHKVQEIYVNIQQTHVQSLRKRHPTQAATLYMCFKYFVGLVHLLSAPQKCSENVTAPVLMTAHFKSNCL